MSPGRRGLRVLGGRWRGRRLTVPRNASPTQARVREALFSRWAGRVVDCRLLELYAGSGAVSFEALSRGAAFALTVDRSADALRSMATSSSRLEISNLQVVRANLPQGLSAAVRDLPAFHLAFIDPPYDATCLDELLVAVSGLIADGGEVVLEHSSRRPAPRCLASPRGARLRRLATRRYGDTALTFYEALAREQVR